jgi:hypothetical protein
MPRKISQQTIWFTKITLRYSFKVASFFQIYFAHPVHAAIYLINGIIYLTHEANYLIHEAIYLIHEANYLHYEAHYLIHETKKKNVFNLTNLK